MRGIIDPIWPLLGRLNVAQREAAHAKLEADVAVINSMAWKKDNDAVLEEARRLADDEVATRSTVETRAGVFLATIGTLIPVVIFVADAITSDTMNSVVDMLKVALSIIASVYLAGALWWSLQALAVKTYHRVGAADLVAIASETGLQGRLTEEILKGVRRNRDVINSKVDAIKMAQRFLWRSIVFLLLLLITAQLPNGVFDRFFAPAAAPGVTCTMSSDSVDYFDACKLVSER